MSKRYFALYVKFKNNKINNKHEKALDLKTDKL